MKIEMKQKRFEPVTITLETQEELDFFTSVFYNVAGEAAIDTFGSTGYIMRQLESFGGHADRYVPVGGSGIYLEEREDWF